MTENPQYLECTEANKDWTPSEGGQLRIYKRRPNPYQLEKGAEEMKDDQAKDVLQSRRRFIDGFG